MVVVTRPVLLVLDDREGELTRSAGLQRMRGLAEIHVLAQPLADTPDELVARAQIIMAVRERTRLDRAALSRMPSLELILQTGGHAYHIDLDEAARRGIAVALWRFQAACEAAVREMTFGLMIAAMRHLPDSVRDGDAGRWVQNLGGTLRGRRLGILGLGRQGHAVAQLAHAFEMDVVASVSESGTPPADGTPRIPLDELLATSDVVSVHLRLSERSRGYLSRERLQRMKPGSVLINTARGAIVDEHALADVLRDGPLRGAGLDVFADEPLAADSPLRRLGNVVLSPHVGWVVEEAFAEFARGAADQLHDYLQGRLPSTELAFEVARGDRGARLGGIS